MEITALCLRLVVNVLMLLVSQVQCGYQAQRSDPAFLHVVPNRLQHFEYDPVSFNCEGLDGSSGWRVMREINQTINTCVPDWETSKKSNCSTKNAFTVESGKYWCENGKGERSDAVNITITAGSVILESPVLPVMEGSDVTLRCKTKKTPSDLTADFYKDGLLIRTDSTGEMTIHSVSKSDEGLYKCSMSDSGESPERWLAVTDPAFLHVVPNRLQHFEYDSVSFNCEGLDGSSGWRVMREINQTINTCVPDWETSKESNCSTENAFTVESGKYWCENGKGERSDAVNITITAGSVILESPVFPVMEGSDVTLHCKTKKTPSNLTADFYKDGLLIRTDSTGEMTIHSVSKSDEGLYKCSMSDSGESPESWLAVTATSTSQTSTREPGGRGITRGEEGLHAETHDSPHLIFLIRTVLTILVVVVMVLMGPQHCWKWIGRSCRVKRSWDDVPTEEAV